ncbi:PAS domain S-box protein [uncultured Thiodictyon sp.]|jgi:PAS domain S-box-containing protein|uniref:PAS domain-containing sensor histidine kinase n=1 Tax=uncultured Thiodictyon sp. TaxID=1846217 RepID=UPI0025FB3D54|nr:PAS domain S-box protein [uncultured Thiodictyon sp.]
MNPDPAGTAAADLPRQAEPHLVRQPPDTTAVQSVGDLERLVHELQARRRGLEIENEQLRESRANLEAALAMNLASNALECRALVVDVTERKQMEERLRISEERYRLLAETAIDVIWTMNLDGRFTFVSPSVQQLRGFTPEEVLQQSFEDIFPPASLALVHEQFGRFLAEFHAGAPTGTMRLELEHKCKDGSTVWTDVIACLTISADSTFVEILGVTRDISERKQAEAAQRVRLAERSRMQEREQLLQDLHDGFASQLASACLRNEYRVLNRAEVGALLRECLDDLHLVVEALGPEDLSLNDAIADYRYRCESRLSGLGMQVDWVIELSACPPLERRTLLNILRILQESLNNAVKHAQARQIRVAACCHPDGQLRIAVCDDGIGLPAVPAAGRGLANMQRRARDIGGRLAFTPLAPGTSVSLTLSLSPAPVSPRA